MENIKILMIAENKFKESENFYTFHYVKNSLNRVFIVLHICLTTVSDERKLDKIEFYWITLYF